MKARRWSRSRRRQGELPSELSSEIIERTDGVPLFVEELTKAVLEAGATQANSTLTAARDGADVPATLHASLMARLDRLGLAAKEVAQVGAAIGREFSYELLAAVATAATLSCMLRSISSSAPVSRSAGARRRRPPTSSSTRSFRTRRMARCCAASGRSCMPASPPRSRNAFPRRRRPSPKFSPTTSRRRGRLRKPPITGTGPARWRLARSAIPEAVAQLGKGLAVLEKLPDGAERQRRELGLQMTLGGVLIAAKGYAAPETGATFARARELCHHVGDATTTFRVLYGEFAYLTVKGELIRAGDAAQEFLRLAQRDGSSAVLVIGHRSVAVTCFSWAG